MGKTVKVLLVLTLLISISCFTLGVVSAQQAGMSIADIAKIVQSNMEILNINPVTQEYSEIRETMTLQEHEAKPKIVIRNSFPDLTITAGTEFKVELLGEVSSKLTNLLSWSADLDTIYINIASVFNENPSSTGLVAVVTLPQPMIDDLRITSISGDIQLADLPPIQQSKIEIKSGNVEIKDSAIRDLSVVSQSGSISIADFDAAKLELTTGSGDLSLSANRLSGVLKSNSGRIKADINDLSDALTLTNQSGNIDIVYRGPNLKYDLSSQTGQLTVNSKEFKQQVTADLQKKGALLKAVSVSGSVDLQIKD